MIRPATLTLLAALLAAGGAAPAPAGDEDCMGCHADAGERHLFHPAMAAAAGGETAPEVSCKDCHGAHTGEPIGGPGSPFAPARLPAACGRCHEGIARQFAASEHGKALAEGGPGAPDCLSCHRHPLTGRRGGQGPAALKLTQEKICLSCHLDNAGVRARMGPAAGFIAAFETSVHGRALLAGNQAAPTCIDCHGTHDVRHGADPDAHVSKGHIPRTCSRCHAGQAAEYGRSVHARAVARGVAEAPVCTDCHGEHTILQHTDPRAPVASANVSAQVCSPCHASVRLSEKFGMEVDRTQTFADSFHGLALRGGAVESAHCASCHGAHAILPSSDPASSVHKDNLAATCGACHQGANERFAIGSVHVAASPERSPILYWIANVYIVMIAATIGGMFAHNLADFVRKSVTTLRARRSGAGQERPAGRGLYVRMTLNERWQHLILMVSFGVLAVTGFMLSYPEAWWVAGLRRLGLGVFETRGLLHRAAAVLMTGASLYHLGYVAFTRRGRRLLRDLAPRRSDLTDSLRNVAYNLGLASRRPRFGRFGYVEKSEYWALVWGTFIMAGTGVVMWFENTFIGLFTKLGWDIARTIHFYEAWLATLAILVWHLYHVILNPDVYPMNLAWLTGKLSEAEMEEEHPAELAAVKAARAAREQEESSDGTS
ncbi:MAG TPA: cytochrome b/b6 domain-containing protein [Candidatus Polarisedimenticolia bacterium]|nr:cytochrome b/b6 domain-containing protein [Candidatus Polarisedimenticolia bacterium]